MKNSGILKEDIHSGKRLKSAFIISLVLHIVLLGVILKTTPHIQKPLMPERLNVVYTSAGQKNENRHIPSSFGGSPENSIIALVTPDGAQKSHISHISKEYEKSGATPQEEKNCVEPLKDREKGEEKKSVSEESLPLRDSSEETPTKESFPQEDKFSQEDESDNGKGEDEREEKEMEIWEDGIILDEEGKGGEIVGSAEIKGNNKTVKSEDGSEVIIMPLFVKEMSDEEIIASDSRFKKSDRDKITVLVYSFSLAPEGVPSNISAIRKSGNDEFDKTVEGVISFMRFNVEEISEKYYLPVVILNKNN